MKDIDALVDKTMEALGFTQDQTREELRASLMEARALGLEEAAKVCEPTLAECRMDASLGHLLNRRAAAIRALKDQP